MKGFWHNSKLVFHQVMRFQIYAYSNKINGEVRLATKPHINPSILCGVFLSEQLSTSSVEIINDKTRMLCDNLTLVIVSMFTVVLASVLSPVEYFACQWLWSKNSFTQRNFSIFGIFSVTILTENLWTTAWCSSVEWRQWSKLVTRTHWPQSGPDTGHCDTDTGSSDPVCHFSVMIYFAVHW